MIDEVYKQLVEKTKSTEGAKVENNKFCVSVHFRCVEEKVYCNHHNHHYCSWFLWLFCSLTVYVHLNVYILMYSCQTWKTERKKKSLTVNEKKTNCRNGVNWPSKLNQYWKSTQNYVLPKEERWHGILNLSIFANNLVLVNNGSLISVLFV